MASLTRLLTIAALLGAASPARADCGDDPTDAGAVSAARAEAAARCDCATAPGHRRYVDCVEAAANEAVRAGLLPRRCRGAVAAVQTQAREIEALRAEVAALRRELRARAPAPCESFSPR